MKLCEIVRADKTAPDALVTAVAVAAQDRQGAGWWSASATASSATACWRPRGKQSEKLLFEGALPQQVDAVVTKFGMPMGPFAMGDLAGLDIGWRSRRTAASRRRSPMRSAKPAASARRPARAITSMKAGSRSPVPDPDVEKLIDETLQKLGLKRRAVSDDEILERMMYPMINEGARILEERIAARPSDIDVIWLYGYGWPIYRGGPMF